MARVALLLLVCYNPAIAQDEWIVVRCFGDVVQFSVKAFPNGIPMSDRAICKCLAKRWRGADGIDGPKRLKLFARGCLVLPIGYIIITNL